MSWDSYIDNLVAHSQDGSGAAHVDKACIIGIDGAAWTTPGHPCAIKLDPQEASTIAGSFKRNDFTTFQANGIRCEQTKYQFLRADEGMVMAKKKDCGAVSIGASKTAIVIAHTKEGQQQGNSNKAVNTIVEYLKSMDM